MPEWKLSRVRMIPEEETYIVSLTLADTARALGPIGHVSYIEFVDGRVTVVSAAAWFGADTRSLEIPDGCTVDEAKASVEALLALEDHRG